MSHLPKQTNLPPQKPAKPPVTRKPLLPLQILDYLYEGDRRDRSFMGTFMPAALMVLIALLLLLFAAVTYATADAPYQSSEANIKYCTDYYTAETIATEILADFAENRNQQTVDVGSRSIYESDKGDILVFKADSSISFTVPINKKESLAVIATLSDGNVQLIQWTIE